MALGAAGQAGVEHYLEMIKNELETSMVLYGKQIMTEIDTSLLLNPTLFDQKNGIA